MTRGGATTGATGATPEWCVNCGTAIPPDAAECPQCGVRRIPLGPPGVATPFPPTPGAAADAGYPTPGAYAQPGSSQPGYAPPGYAPPGYPQPGYGGVPYPPMGYTQQTNNKATTSLVLGIIGLVVCQIASIFAIVIGNQAAREIRYSGGTQTGESMATAGRILGWIGVGLLVIAIIALIVVVGVGVTTTSS